MDGVQSQPQLYYSFFSFHFIYLRKGTSTSQHWIGQKRWKNVSQQKKIKDLSPLLNVNREQEPDRGDDDELELDGDLLEPHRT